MDQYQSLTIKEVEWIGEDKMAQDWYKMTHALVADAQHEVTALELDLADTWPAIEGQQDKRDVF